ncbi:MAG: DNA polymerase I [Gloeomargaritaceae cyanobacterium C42_A2020_066]|nr:DNA polymerase I [Gloeomargaritaceae cyanobacterium C42_A2020_066]
MPQPVLLLIDGHSLAFRAFYAFARGRDGGLRTSTGIPTSVSFGFLKTLLEVLQQENATHLAIAFDVGEPTFRHQADATYKDGRPETPPDFHPDVANLQAVLAALNLTTLKLPGFEADDILGTLAIRAAQAGYAVKILSGDQDLFQMVDPDQGIGVLHLGGSGGRPTPCDPAAVEAKLGIRPDQVVDYKALCGDSSDNIPGVRGIGPKTAVSLLKTWGTLENLYAHLEQLPASQREKLAAGREAAFHAQFLARIHRDVPLEVDLDACQLRGFDLAAVQPWLEKLEFQSFLRQLRQLQTRLGGVPVAAPADSDPDPDGEDALWFYSPADTARAHAPFRVQIIDTPEALATLIHTLETCQDAGRPVAWDTETTGLEPRDATLVGLGCCWGSEPDQVAYVPLGHTAGRMLDLGTTLAALAPVLQSPQHPKALQNAKYDRLVLQHQGIHLRGVVFDTLLAAYLLNPESSHKLADLGYHHLGLVAQTYDDLVPRGQTLADRPIFAVAQYCGMDAYTVFHLVPKLRHQLAEVPALQTLLETVELPLEPILAEMETWGICLDVPYLEILGATFDQELQRIEAEAHAAAGRPFNLNSPRQLGEILFDELGLSKKKTRKTKTGYATDAATLEKLRDDHPLVEWILEHRTLAKLKSTYVDALPQLVRPDTGRLHTDFNQAVTATGRLSSSNPNLQNIPIRTELGRQIRAAFIPEPCWRLVSADYSQIQLRILAHLSQEPVLVTAYQTNQDVHTLTAQILLDTDTVTADQRRLAKIINYGVIYGMGPQRFMREAGVSYAEAKGFIARFYERYPAVFGFLQRMERLALTQGYVETVMGRRRYFEFTSAAARAYRGQHPDTLNDEGLTKGFSPGDSGLLRAAANAPIQGSSADLIKQAMVRLRPALAGFQTRMLLQVHDELVFEVPPSEWPAVEPVIRAQMTEALALSVPLQVDIKAGRNWMEAK